MQAQLASDATLPLALSPLADQRNQWSAFTTNPLPFDDAAERVLDAHASDGVRRDMTTADLGWWMLGSCDSKTMHIAPVPAAGRERTPPLPLREHAFQQLCTRIGAPAPYLRELPARLQMAALNWGLSNHKGPATLRLARGEVRAIVSDRYAAVDDTLLLSLVAECLDRAGMRGEARVRAIATGAHTVLRVTLPSNGVAVQRGDVIEYGIDIANSELGMRSVQITPVTYRLICTNGMRGWASQDAFRMRHVGDPDRLREHLRDAIPVALASARGDIDRWKRAVDLMIDAALDEVESLRGFGLTKAETQSVTHALSSDNRLPSITSVFDVANAITATARERDDAAARLRLEEVGHRYLVSRTR